MKFQVLNQGNVAALSITGHQFDEMVALFDVTHTQLAQPGRTARLAGKGDSGGTVNGDHDADLPLYLNPPNILPGTPGIFLLFISAQSLNRPYQIPAIVEKVHWQGAVDQKVSWTFDWKENALAGLFVRPAA